MKNFQIKTTSNYNIFLHVIGNREINKANVNRLKESIKDIGLQVPILVNQNKAVVDGQHRTGAYEEVLENLDEDERKDGKRNLSVLFFS